MEQLTYNAGPLEQPHNLSILFGLQRVEVADLESTILPLVMPPIGTPDFTQFYDKRVSQQPPRRMHSIGSEHLQISMLANARFTFFPPTGTYPVNIVEYFEEDDASSVESHLDVEGDMRVWEHTGDATTWSVWLVESCSGEDDSTSSRRTAEVPKCMHLIPACVVVAVTAAATTDDDGGNVDGDGDGDVGGSDDGGSGGDGDCRPNSCRQKQLNKGEEVGVSIIENDSMTGNKNESSKEKKEEEEEKVVVVEEEEEEEEGEKEEGEGEGEGESERKDEWRMLKMEEKVEMEMEMEMGMEVETVDLAKTEDEVEVEVEVEVGADAEETRIKAEGKRRSVGWLKRFRARVKNRFRLSRLRACGWRRKGMLQ
ncbi:hypothetical protein TcWFU_000116 [Taenia crassiceps]|uniref:Uncharacterized protein n=1 Tax=Taenia crassiceps TaxID=6207 RepID=A0ABR4Q0Y5_9CEST